MFEYKIKARFRKQCILGEVGDRSGYKISCLIVGHAHQMDLTLFDIDQEFIFVGGSTIEKGILF